MMRAALALCAVAAVQAFAPPTTRTAFRTARTWKEARREAMGTERGVLVRRQAFGRQKEAPVAQKKLSAAEKAELYWAGDWVCADCGYVYDKKLFGGRYFEEQTFGFKCPQCSGPRRRYAKMIGDTVGVTLDGGDGPILFWSGVGFLFTIALGVWISSSDF